MFATIIDNIKTIGICIGTITACGTGYVALDGPVPVSRQYVVAETQQLKQTLGTRVIDNQLQLNTVQRNLLRKEKFDRDLELQKEPTPSVRSILQQRRDQIDDELDNIEKEREELRKEKLQK